MLAVPWHMRTLQFFVYIAASRSGVLYVGVTNDLGRRMAQHRTGIGGQFTRRYQVRRLVYFETLLDPMRAIIREKQIKGWARSRKVGLIRQQNPEWRDLGVDLGLYTL